MNILVAVLILGATGSAERRLETDQEIAGIVLRCVIGGVSDVLGNGLVDLRGGGILETFGGNKPRLFIDGQPRTGWRSWAEAAWRVIGYAATDARHGQPGADGVVGSGRGDYRGIAGDESVRLAYRLRVRRFDIATSTTVSDGRVGKIVDAWWTEVVPIGRQTREVPIHVTIRIEATENGGTTRFFGYATGTANTSDFRCRLVRRFAERAAASTLEDGLSDALATIEHKGTDWYHQTDEYTAVLDRIGNAMRTVGRIRR